MVSRFVAALIGFVCLFVCLFVCVFAVAVHTYTCMHNGVTVGADLSIQQVRQSFPLNEMQVFVFFGVVLCSFSCFVLTSESWPQSLASLCLCV